MALKSVFRVLKDYRGLADVVLLAVGNIALYYVAKSLLARYIPRRADYGEQQRNRHNNKESLELMETMRKRLGVLDLNEHERAISSEILSLAGDEVPGFGEIGGLEHITTDLMDSVILPLLVPAFQKTSLLSPPKGVLFFGPPGCGKTMLARAIAKESGATFINLCISTLTDKWFGESQKLVKALFTLSRKLQPTIIFIDEIDSFLRQRNSNDHETMGMMKAEFLALWDGLNSSDNDRIIVIGATNRPDDLDAAVLRRLPKRYAIALPNKDQRLMIMKKMLKSVSLNVDVDLNRLALESEGCSGSDLLEMCRSAAMRPFREYVHSQNISDYTKLNCVGPLRPLCNDDFDI